MGGREVWAVWSEGDLVGFKLYGQSEFFVTLDEARELAESIVRVVTSEECVVIQGKKVLIACQVDRFGGPAWVLSRREATDFAQALYQTARGR